MACTPGPEPARAAGLAGIPAPAARRARRGRPRCTPCDRTRARIRSRPSTRRGSRPRQRLRATYGRRSHERRVPLECPVLVRLHTRPASSGTRRAIRVARSGSARAVGGARGADRTRGSLCHRWEKRSAHPGARRDSRATRRSHSLSGHPAVGAPTFRVPSANGRRNPGPVSSGNPNTIRKPRAASERMTARDWRWGPKTSTAQRSSPRRESTSRAGVIAGGHVVQHLSGNGRISCVESDSGEPDTTSPIFLQSRHCVVCVGRDR